jgi:hypothetical protein
MQLVNLIANEESIKVKAINIDTNCFNESSFKLIVNPLPIKCHRRNNWL